MPDARNMRRTSWKHVLLNRFCLIASCMFSKGRECAHHNRTAKRAFSGPLHLSAKFSALKEHDELRALMEENLRAAEVNFPTLILTIRYLISPLIESQVSFAHWPSLSRQCVLRLTLNSRSRMLLVSPSRWSTNMQDSISVRDLEKTFTVIKHNLEDEVGLAGYLDKD
ncbi:hypothetical protein OG21DRAFT_533819 [Imleria badia]|nr:hypothetical protein OG21DRAFT_533819 [Imleria badia]